MFEYIWGKGLYEMTNPQGSIQDPYYTSGAYLQAGSGDLDSDFKVNQLMAMLKGNSKFPLRQIHRIADVGCGTGGTTLRIRDAFVALGIPVEVEGYDIHPGIETFKNGENLTFHREDFPLVETEPFDMVTLFDVIEHIPDPINYLRAVAGKTRWIALHFPLDNSFLVNFRNLSRAKLTHPGHLIVLDHAAALNLVTFAGVSIRDNRFTPNFRSPGSRISTFEKILYPFRNVLFTINPYLAQRTLAAASLMAIAQTPLDMTSTHPQEAV